MIDVKVGDGVKDVQLDELDVELEVDFAAVGLVLVLVWLPLGGSLRLLEGDVGVGDVSGEWASSCWAHVCPNLSRWALSEW